METLRVFPARCFSYNTLAHRGEMFAHYSRAQAASSAREVGLRHDVAGNGIAMSQIETNSQHGKWTEQRVPARLLDRRHIRTALFGVKEQVMC